MSYDPLLEESIKLNRDPLECENPATAYHVAMAIIIRRQCESIRLVEGRNAPLVILVDGGFARNAVYMGMLARAFPGTQVEAASLPQASALGAAMALG